jgi:hypothetical protein
MTMPGASGVAHPHSAHDTDRRSGPRELAEERVKRGWNLSSRLHTLPWGDTGER